MANSNFEKYIRLYEPVMKGMKDLIGNNIEFILHEQCTQMTCYPFHFLCRFCC